MPHKEFLQKLDDLEQIDYCIGERDESTFSIGIFAYDTNLFDLTGKYWAITQLFDSTDALFDHARAKGFVYRCILKPYSIGRSPC